MNNFGARYYIAAIRGSSRRHLCYAPTALTTLCGRWYRDVEQGTTVWHVGDDEQGVCKRCIKKAKTE